MAIYQTTKARKGGSVVYPGRDIVFLLPSLLGFLIFYVIPLLLSLYHATVESAFIPRFVGVKNIQTILHNRFYQLALTNSLLLVLAVPLCLVALSLPLALSMRRLPVLRPFQSVFLAPAFLPSAAIAMIWGLIFSKEGSAAQFLAGIGGLPPGMTVEWLALFALAVWKNIGIASVLMMGALSALDAELENAAALDGANRVKRFVYIVFPQLKPAIMFTLIYAVMSSMRLYREAYLLYGSYPGNSVYLIQHYMNNHFIKLNYQYMASGSMMLAVMISLGMLPLMRVMRHFSEEDR